MRKDIMVGIALVFSVILLSADIAIFPPSMATEEHPIPIHSDYVTHDPILIEDSTNSSEFESLGFPGNGTADKPFVIEGLSIVGNDTVPCIEIRNPKASYGITNKYFIIRNCILSGRGGIYLSETTVGIIENNSISNPTDGWGIETIPGNTVGLVYNTTIRKNEFSDNYNGNIIAIWGRTRNFTIDGNVGYGRLKIESPRSTSITNNAFDEVDINGGTTYQSAIANTIYNNTVSNLYIDDFDFFVLTNNTISSLLRIRDSDNGNVYGNDVLGRFMLGYYSGGHYYPAINTTISWNVFNDDVWQVHGNPNHFDYNWYFDYVGVDENGDGIGDEPYIQDTGDVLPKPPFGLEEVTDQHPLIELRGFITPEPEPTTTATITTGTNTTTSTTTTSTNHTASNQEFPFLATFSILGGACGIISLVIVIIYIRKR